MHNITLSPNSLALASAMAAKKGVPVSAYIEGLIMTVSVPEIIGMLTDQPPAPFAFASPPNRVEEELAKVAVLTPPAEPKKKKRKKQRKSWLCPCCNEKYRATGNKLHFLSCATKAGLTVREIALFCHGDLALSRMYGCTPSSTVEEILSGIIHIAKAVNQIGKLKEVPDIDSIPRQRLTAKSRLIQRK